ncbi:predicted protein [Thalassiosira pseudonana CCMP1335]|uniref:Uncharacterized protein n=1 Tax=Thalassiosira pseudonana TaxID=35128 RepID=B8C9P5_THAPS|nr:predicted protein [Thalassiosira pseudonana CCMP1335]EED89895.1 predicted protein [Thalassiosira pseudonana CCMP1335]
MTDTKRPHPSSSQAAQAIIESAMSAMTSTTKPPLYDVTIVCTTDDYQAAYWMDRLSNGVCKKPTTATGNNDEGVYPMVLAVSEDWSPSGAGNGLGTLYAFQKACRVAQEKFGVDIGSDLKGGKISAALFHTAGKGTRLAPLPASENNNKPGVKLPVCHQLADGSYEPITVLEAVVRQTGIYAASRSGRLSVYWGDQIFVPTAPFEYTPSHHVDIMCTLEEEPPTEKVWQERGLEKYGVIAVAKGESGDAAQVEKVDHPTAVRMLKNLGDIGRVGPSLGSFSVSAKILEALCEEFKEELASKDGKLDTDPHFWMPLTLPQDEYISLMSQKGVEEDESRSHHMRMSKMKESFMAANSELGLFGAVDVGNNACWWDYGQLKLYITNNLKLSEDGADADLLRRFFGVTSRVMNSELSGVNVDASASVSSCKAKSGSVGAHSSIAAVEAEEIQIGEDAIVVNCAAKKIVAGKGAVLYNLISESEDGIVAEDGDVIVAVTDTDGKSMLLKSKIDICGGQAWKKVLDGNTVSFEEVHKQNRDADVSTIEKKRKELYKKASSSFGL